MLPTYFNLSDILLNFSSIFVVPFGVIFSPNWSTPVVFPFMWSALTHSLSICVKMSFFNVILKSISADCWNLGAWQLLFPSTLKIPLQNPFLWEVSCLPVAWWLFLSPAVLLLYCSLLFSVFILLCVCRDSWICDWIFLFIVVYTILSHDHFKICFLMMFA